MTEIEIRGHRPYAFEATADELEEAFAAIDDDVLLEAYEGEWLRCGLEPPGLTVADLRERILELNRQKAERMPRERLLSISEARRTSDCRSGACATRSTAASTTIT